MTKKQIKEMDSIKDGSACSAAVTHKGYTVAKIEKGVFCSRDLPVGYAWMVFAKPIRKKGAAIIYITPRDNVVIFENNHFRIDI
jgi:hypothetical protein